MGIKIEGKIQRINGKELSYEEFVEKYMEKNEPVVITGLTDDWRGCKDWVNHEDGKPNLEFIATHFGKSKVQEFTDQKRSEMAVSEFVKRWIEDSSQQHCNLSSDDNKPNSVLYLKDWHFVKEYQEYVAYTTPKFFCDDWLNMYLDQYRMHMDPDIYQNSDDICSSDYRFVYMGAKGSWTPLHADVFRSYSWSANVCGKKRWLFLSPSQSHLVFDRYRKNSVYNIFDDIDEHKFSSFPKAVWLECIQEKNEIIYVPSGWYHQVHNLEDTISINHNWFNSHSLPCVWDLLLRDYDEAKEYIEDIRDISDDFEGLCQRNVAANTGMNFYDFFLFLARIFLANLVQLCYLIRESGNPMCSESMMAKHFTLNITAIRNVASKMRSVEGFTKNRVTFNIWEALEDSSFLKLCTSLGRTYWKIYIEKEHSPDDRDLIGSFKNLKFLKAEVYQICSPEELVRYIDNVFLGLSGCRGDETKLFLKLSIA